MPTYTYYCEPCGSDFERKDRMKDHKPKRKCPTCKKMCRQALDVDIACQNHQVRLNHSDIKSLGHYADRNTQKMSEDERASIERKNNKYREKPDGGRMDGREVLKQEEEIIFSQEQRDEAEKAKKQLHKKIRQKNKEKKLIT